MQNILSCFRRPNKPNSKPIICSICESTKNLVRFWDKEYDYRCVVCITTHSTKSPKECIDTNG